VAAVLVEARLADLGLELLGDTATVLASAWGTFPAPFADNLLSDACTGLSENFVLISDMVEELVLRDLRCDLASSTVGLMFKELLLRRSMVEMTAEFALDEARCLAVGGGAAWWTFLDNSLVAERTEVIETSEKIGSERVDVAALET